MTKKTELIEFGMATVTPSGLKFQGRMFTNTKMIKNQWFLMSQLYGEWEVPVIFKPAAPDSIAILDIKGVEVASTVVVSQISDLDVKEAYFEAFNNLKTRLALQRNSLHDPED
ncbi:hypothetical protein [Cohnella candidum]|uniref:Uncharacterized protein n=1 Tax=Cohnella candidum TaxID=2674991 RepID=A0A3G3JW26_9BACL|nr:hypothetical protein [Cohnella candidum]AYQ72453.1 hypothetical protein EAV92_07655 [Cohnella candidum]